MSGSVFNQLVARIAEGREGAMDRELRSVTFDLGNGALLELADEGDDVLGLYAIVAAFDEDPGEAIFKDLAIANYGCAGTNGATLGYDPETRTLLLVRYWPIGAMETDAAVDLVGLFVETLLTWRDRTERLRSASLGPETPASAALDQNPTNFA